MWNLVSKHLLLKDFSPDYSRAEIPDSAIRCALNECTVLKMAALCGRNMWGN